MRDDDIEILEDFSDNREQSNNQFNPSMSQPTQVPYNNPVPDYNMHQTYQPIANPMPQAPSIQENNSVNEFEKMVTEVNNPEPEPINTADYSADYNNYQDNNQNNNFNDLHYVNDTNNELVQQPANDDLTITAIYPNGFVVPDQEEQEDTRVVKPKKQKGDLFLIIIVAVLAITLVAMLVIFYL